MEHFENVFDHWSQYRVIYCRRCRFCPVPDQVFSHLKQYHSHLSLAVRKEIVSIVDGLPDLARQLKEVRYPVPTDQCIPQLEVFDNGSQCLGIKEDGQCCGQVLRTTWSMQKHCADKHGWTNEQKRGGDVRTKHTQAPNRMWVEGQRCQTFFHFKPWSRLFIVDQSRSESGHHGVSRADEILQRGRAMLAQHRRALEEYQQQKTIGDGEHHYTANAWLERTGWEYHLKNYTKAQLPELIRLPQPDQVAEPQGDDGDEERKEASRVDELGLWRACRMTAKMISRARHACHPSKMGLSTLQLLNCREIGQSSNEKPLYGRHHQKTVGLYTQHWIRILCYIWRTHDSQDPAPGYRLTRQQRQCFAAFRQAVDSFHRRKNRNHWQRLEEACLAFWVSLLDHDLGSHQYQNALVSGAAVLGWDVVKKVWKRPQQYTQILSGLITVARMVVGLYACEQHEADVRRLRDEGWDEVAVEQQALSIFSLVQSMVQRFMTLTQFDGKPSPMDFFYHTRTIGRSICMNTASEGRVSWHQDEVQYGSTRFTMSKLRGMVHGLVEKTRTRLYRDLLLLNLDQHGQVQKGSTPLPELDLDRLRDDPTNIADGWSFLSGNGGVLPVHGADWLHDRVLTERYLQQQFVLTGPASEDCHPGIHWRPARIKQFFDVVLQVKQALLVLIHLTGGGPGRGTEILTVRYRNDSTGEGRGVFVDGGLVDIVVGYHKGYGYSAKSKIIHRFLPREVSELVVYYLWLVQPFVEILQMYRDGQKDFGAWLWEPKGRDEVSTDEDEDDFDDDPQEDALEPLADGDEDDAFERHVDPTVVDISPPKPVSTNVDGFWDTNRVRNTLERATEPGMGAKVGIMAWRHLIKAIMREFTRDPQVLQMFEDEGGRHEKSDDEVRDRQFGHSPWVAGMVYGRSVQEFPGQTACQRDAFRRVSVEWHRFLGFTSAPDAVGQAPIAKSGWGHTTIEAQRVQNQRWYALARADLTLALREMLNQPDAQFRGRQREVLEAIVARRSWILAVMGTGVGKSLLFMLPAMLSSPGMTIVVVPLLSLKNHLRDRCLKLGIRCEMWDADKQPDGAQIVLVTPEGTTSDAFHTFMNRQRLMGVIDRIVFDECHVALDSMDGFRLKVLEMEKLSQYQTQLVYLTATLKPADEETWFRVMGLPMEKVLTVRDVTTRRNIRYRVRLYHDDEDEDEQIRKLVQRKRRQYPLPDQIIVYCGTVDRTKKISQALGCPAYYSGVGSAEKKDHILQQLITGREQVFATTNALGLGIDRRSVRVVIHVDMPHRIEDFVQESGRAGRDGLMCESIVMQPVRSRGRRINVNEDVDMHAFMTGQECRRVILDRAMDGRNDRVRCENGEEICDVCARERRPTPGGRNPIKVNASQPSQKRGHPDIEEEVIRTEGGSQGRLHPMFPDHDVRRSKKARLGEQLRLAGTMEARETRLRSPPPPLHQPVDQHQQQQDHDDYDVFVHHVNHERREQVVQDHIQLEKRAQAVEDVADLPIQLNQWHDICPLCMVRGRERVRHRLDMCPETVDAAKLQRRSDDLRKRIRYDRFVACFDCGIAQEICDQWESSGNAGGWKKQPGQRCQYRSHFHMAVVVALMEFGLPEMVDMFRTWVDQAFGEQVIPLDGNGGAALQAWGRKIRWGGVEMSPLLRLFSQCSTFIQYVREQWARSAPVGV